MVFCKCIEKIRDKNGIITGYLMDDFNGQQMLVQKDIVKDCIANGTVTVTNLNLSKDGKLTDRATAEEARILSSINKSQVSEKDEHMYNKGRLLDTVPEINDNGEVINLPNSNIVYISPNIKSIRKFSTIHGTIVFEGNNSVDINSIEADKIVIKNPLILGCLASHLLSANEEIIISLKKDTVKIIDFIFKVMKTSIDDIYWKICPIKIDNNTLNKEEAYSRMIAILKRQKPSSHYDRRAYDILIYLWLESSLAMSYNEKEFMYNYDEYLSELRACLRYTNGRSRNSNYNYYISSNESYILAFCDAALKLN